MALIFESIKKCRICDNQLLEEVLNLGDQLTGKLMIIDALDLTFRSIKINKDNSCLICGKH